MWSTMEVGTPVWVPDTRDVWRAGTVVALEARGSDGGDGSLLKVELDATGAATGDMPLTVRPFERDVFQRNSTVTDVDDLIGADAAPPAFIKFETPLKVNRAVWIIDLGSFTISNRRLFEVHLRVVQAEARYVVDVTQVVHTFEEIAFGSLAVSSSSDDQGSWNPRILSSVIHIGW